MRQVRGRLRAVAYSVNKYEVNRQYCAGSVKLVDTSESGDLGVSFLGVRYQLLRATGKCIGAPVLFCRN